MAGNLYDDALEHLEEQTPEQQKDPVYDQALEALDRMDGRQQVTLKSSLHNAEDQNPDQAAEARKLSLRYGVPPGIIQGDLDTWRKRAAGDKPVADMVNQTPKLAEWAADPFNSQVAHDDMEQLGTLEWLVTAPSRQFAQTVAQARYAELRFRGMFTDLTQEERDLSSAYRMQSRDFGALGVGDSWFRKGVTGAASLIANQAPAAKYGVVGYMGGLAAGAAGAALIGPEVAAGALATAAIGGRAGLLYGVVKSTLQGEAAGALDEFEGFRDEHGQSLDPNVAKAAALAVGAINAPIEAWGLESVLESIPGLKELSAAAVRGTIKEALRKPTIRLALTEMVSSYGKALTSETAQEVAQRAVTILGGELAKAGAPKGVDGQLEPGNVNLYQQPEVSNPDGTVSTVDSLSVNIDGQEILLPTVTPDGRHFTGDKAVDQAVEEFNKTGRHLGKFKTPEAASKFAQQIHTDYAAGVYQKQPGDNGLLPDRFRTIASIGADLGTETLGAVQSFALGLMPGPGLGLAMNVRRARTATEGATLFQALGEGVANSKTAKRLPEAMQSFLEHATKDGPIATVYAPADTWVQYWQDKGVDPAEMAAEVTGRKDALEQALNHGGDLAIPTSRYAVKLAGTEHNAYFSQELRLGPDEMNAREAKDFAQQVVAASHKNASTDEAVGPSPLQQKVIDSLQAAGLTKKDAETYGELFSLTKNLGDRAGLEEDQVLKPEQLEIDRKSVSASGRGAANNTKTAASGASEASNDAQIAPEGASVTPVPEAQDAAIPGLDALEAELGGASLETVDGEGGTSVNASGDSAASLEATSRQAGMAARGEQFVVFNRAGVGRTLIGPEAVDYQPAKGETYGIRGPNGFQVLTDNGGKVARNLTPEFQAGLGAVRRARIVDKNVGAADTEGAHAGTGTTAGEGIRDGAREQPTADSQRDTEAGGDGGGADVRRLPTAGSVDGEQWQRHDISEARERLTPEVTRELDRIRQELEEFPATGNTWTFVPGKKTGNVGGGDYDRVKGSNGAKVFGDIKLYAPVNIATSGKHKGEVGNETGGSIAKAAAAIARVLEARDIHNALAEGAVRVAELRAAGAYKDINRPELPPTWGTVATPEFLETLSSEIDHELSNVDVLDPDSFEAEILDPEGEVDTSFNVEEFGQSLFEPLPTENEILTERAAAALAIETNTARPGITPKLLASYDARLAALRDPRGREFNQGPVDLFDTGEEQPRLPGAEDVRDQNIQTPEFEAPFSLTAPVAKVGKVAKREATISPEYAAALERSNQASAVFTEATRKYRSKQIDDVAFLQARVANEEATAAFDAAFEKEQNRSSRTTLFQSAPEMLTREGLEAWAVDVQRRAGGDLKAFDLSLLRDGSISLDNLIVDRGAQRAGIGSRTMIELTRLADLNGVRLVLSPAIKDDLHGTTSRARLVTFYKRFGFVENKGRYKDFRLSAAMYREPTVPSTASVKVEPEPRTLEGEGQTATPEFRNWFRSSANILKQDRRGAIRFGPDRQFHVSLFAKADPSTFLHETGHLFLEVFADVADKVMALDPATLTDTQKKLLGDYAGLLGYLGVDDRSQIGVEHHEKFARSFEAYLMRGEAPSVEMQGAFSRFRAWMLAVYRSLKNLRVELTPEVTGILDRMLASDAAIAAAEAQRGVPAMFASAADAGMSEAEFALYKDTVAKASRTAREQLESRLMAEVHREQTAAWQAQRADILQEVTNSVHQRPVYQALAAIQKGTHPNGDALVEGMETEPLKLSRAMIVAQFGEERLKRLPRPYVYSKDGGLDPDLVARMFGYSSGDELLNQLEHAPAMGEQIKAETDQRMIAEHGSILLDGTLHEKAQAAVANEDRDAIIRAEMRALGALRRTVTPFQQLERRQGKSALEAMAKERAYERRWLEAEAKLRIAVAEGKKQVEIDALRQQVQDLKRAARGGAALINRSIPSPAVIKATAAARIASMRIGDIRPQMFWSASRRAAKQAIDRAARQDFDGAIQAKQQELLNLATYREAERALDDVQDRVDYAKGLAKGTARQMLGKAGESILDQVDGILDRFEFATVSKKVLERRADIRKFVEGMESQNLPVELPEAVLDESRRRNWKDLTVEELVGVTDALKQLLNLARLKNRLLKAADRAEFDVTKAAIITSIEASGPARPKVLEFLPKDKGARVVQEWFAAHTKLAEFVERLDGYTEGGAFWSAFMRPINEAATAQAVMHESAARELKAIQDRAYKADDIARLHDLTFIPAINASLSTEARLAVAMNWGNEGNRQRVMDGRSWNEAQVQAILNTLDARDLRYVQETLEHINSYWGQIAAKQERVFGVAPEKVEAASWYHATEGEQAGGYYPIAYDGRLSIRQGNIIDADSANLQKFANYAVAQTKRGYTNARVQRVNAPVRLELSVAREHIEEVIHDLTHHELMIDVGRIMGDRGIQDAIQSRAGDIVYKQMRGTLLDIALGTRHATTVVDRSINYVRNGTTIAGLAWNFWTASQQWVGVTNGAARIGSQWVAKGVMRMFRDASSMESSARWVQEKSDMMRLRGATMNREIADLRSSITRSGSWFDLALRKMTNEKIDQEDVTSSYLWLIEKSQQLADIPVWIGGYEKARAAGVGEAEAIARADQGVLDSQSGGQIKDLAQVQRGGPMFKLFTTFYSYGNLIYNQTAREVGKLQRGGSIGQFLGNLSLIYIAPAVISAALRHAFGKDDDEPFLLTVGKEMLSVAMNTMVLVRELGGVAAMAADKQFGSVGAGGRGYQGPTGLRIFSAIGNLVTQAQQGQADRGLLRATEDVAGILFHLPTAQVQRSIDGFVALEEGRTSNPAALLVGPASKQAK